MDKKYETILVLKGDLTEDDRMDSIKKIIKTIEDLKGKVLASNIWFKDRNLCFPLKSKGAEKKKYFKGSFWIIQFNLETQHLAELKEALRLEERVLRSMILSIKELIA